MPLFGVDIGTQGTKTALYDDDGTLIAEAVEASDLRRPGPGMVEEDADRQVTSVCRTIRSCMEQSELSRSAVHGVAIDGQMAGVIGVDPAGAAITPYDSWLDTRCAPQIESMSERAGREVTELTGCAPSFNHGPKILWWREEHPEVFTRIAAFVQPGGYAAMKLAGLDGSQAFIDRTYLHFSGFADNRSNRWSDDLCREFDVPLDKLPRIASPAEIVGRVTGEMSALTGLAAGTPVVAGCGDTAASFLSCGATRPGVCVDVAGTASVFAATTSEFRADTERLVLGCGQAVVEGLWHPYAYINGGGMNLEWFRTLLGEMSPGAEVRSLEELNELAAQQAEPEALPFFVPHFAGRVSPAMPRLRGAWVGLDWSHGVGSLYRSMLESVAFEYAIYRDVLLDLYTDFQPRELRVTGGGEKSAVWNQIKANVLALPVVSVGGGGAPMGSAMLAGLGTGVFDTLTAASERWVHPGAVADPLPPLPEAYARRAARYAELLEVLNRFGQG